MDKQNFQSPVDKLERGSYEIFSTEYNLAVFDGDEEKKQEQIKRLEELTTGKTISSNSSDDYEIAKMIIVDIHNLINDLKTCFKQLKTEVQQLKAEIEELKDLVDGINSISI
jgi:cell division protein FtsB